ncbi:hypothetical protein HCBAA847_1653 [Helicobacter cinaedi CCUG 18818 = ATCC BAA-847]|uniref:Uncharacterized protein n=1 Tax=Helicobacter cinaedi CCUG 18818 = ATCC BAA-847 TaxID=537971 RepID=A0AAI8MNL1_9HELI|nr:hypothetical protein [Helicobacter cinaedi]EFR45503.1 hypothetical protein HCCG_00049 [Helicobacter cinaedi CCUG 18818 = ATCC BAA-847]BAM32883.1 hypothetical protein HCBAA847_1653 [Helicobacter cinaedi CCUG 18818 = ATCC BAA-847]
MKKIILVSFNSSESLESTLRVYSSTDELREAIQEELETLQTQYFDLGDVEVATQDEIESFLGGLDGLEDYLSLYRSCDGAERAITARVVRL